MRGLAPAVEVHGDVVEARGRVVAPEVVLEPLELALVGIVDVEAVAVDALALGGPADVVDGARPHAFSEEVRERVLLELLLGQALIEL